MNLLQRWLDANGLKQTQLAARTGIPQSEISKYCRWLASGKGSGRRPELDNAFKIEDATDGAVPASTWRLPQRRQQGAKRKAA